MPKVKDKEFKDINSVLDKMKLSKKVIKEVKSNIDSHKLATRLIIARTKSNLTQIEFAKKCKVSLSVIKRIEESKNENIRMKDIMMYSKNLNCNIDISTRNNDMIITITYK